MAKEQVFGKWFLVVLIAVWGVVAWVNPLADTFRVQPIVVSPRSHTIAQYGASRGWLLCQEWRRWKDSELCRITGGPLGGIIERKVDTLWKEIVLHDRLVRIIMKEKERKKGGQ